MVKGGVMRKLRVIDTVFATLLMLVGGALISAVAARSESTTASQTPPAPDMPSGWEVVSDASFAPEDIQPVAKKLGADVSALRNTVYEVDGKRIQLNLIVAPDDENASRILEALRGLKPEEFLLRKGLTVYEFVGKNEAIPEMRAGRAHLAPDEIR
jgi:hypothetical protein